MGRKLSEKWAALFEAQFGRRPEPLEAPDPPAPVHGLLGAVNGTAGVVVSLGPARPVLMHLDRVPRTVFDDTAMTWEERRRFRAWLDRRGVAAPRNVLPQTSWLDAPYPDDRGGR